MCGDTSPFGATTPARGDRGGSPLLAATLHWHGRGGPRSSHAMILSMGHGQALVMADERPPRGRMAALRLGWPAPTGWATAAVVHARRTRLGPCLVRLRIVGRPTATFRMLLGGDAERH